ncbi:hypothetical protein L7F22_031197 [Adiantum nelumboides]|nr:hypothetical protein [Adiantum nelumboides]
MYSASYQQEGGSLFSGGGFMPTQSATQSADGIAKRSGGSQNTGLLPLTVKQISQAVQNSSDDTFFVDGIDVNNVTLVGMVFDKEERATDVSFLIDDGTGRVEVKRWIDGQDTHESMEMAALQNGVYVRVHGHLRSFQGKRNIVAFSVRPVTDFNEITYHFLECIFVHLHNSKANGLSTKSTSLGIQTPSNPVYGGTGGGVGAYNQYMPSSIAAVNGSMDECQKRVHAIFEEPSSLAAEAGLHVDEVARRMPGFNKKQVKDAIEFLVNEGLIYSTIDDFHYKSTNG